MRNGNGAGNESFLCHLKAHGSNRRVTGTILFDDYCNDMLQRYRDIGCRSSGSKVTKPEVGGFLVQYLEMVVMF